jgi:hypothetical protein
MVIPYSIGPPIYAKLHIMTYQGVNILPYYVCLFLLLA